MKISRECNQPSDIFLQGELIVQQIDRQLTTAKIRHSLLISGSLAYRDRQKAKSLNDIDVLLVIGRLEDLEQIYQFPDILTCCGFDKGDTGFLPEEDLSFLKEDRSCPLVRISGSIDGVKTTLNVITCHSLRRFFDSCYQNFAEKLSHGKKVDLQQRRLLNGQTIYIPLDCQDISTRYQEGQHYLIPDQNFYVTSSNDVVIGLLSDFVLTGKVHDKTDNFDLESFQQEVRRRYMKALLYWLPDEFWNSSQTETEKRLESLDLCKGFVRSERFSANYKKMLNQTLLSEALKLIERDRVFYPPKRKVLQYRKTVVSFT